jgi:hypothetical protein
MTTQRIIESKTLEFTISIRIKQTMYKKIFKKIKEYPYYIIIDHMNNDTKTLVEITLISIYVWIGAYVLLVWIQKVSWLTLELYLIMLPVIFVVVTIIKIISLFPSLTPDDGIRRMEVWETPHSP